MGSPPQLFLLPWECLKKQLEWRSLDKAFDRVETEWHILCTHYVPGTESDTFDILPHHSGIPPLLELFTNGNTEAGLFVQGHTHDRQTSQCSCLTLKSSFMDKGGGLQKGVNCWVLASGRSHSPCRASIFPLGFVLSLGQ